MNNTEALLLLSQVWQNDQVSYYGDPPIFIIDVNKLFFMYLQVFQTVNYTLCTYIN